MTFYLYIALGYISMSMVCACFMTWYLSRWDKRMWHRMKDPAGDEFPLWVLAFGWPITLTLTFSAIAFNLGKAIIAPSIRLFEAKD